MYKVKRDWRNRVLVLALLGAAVFLGASLRSASDLRADSRRFKSATTPPVHLKSGAARSEAILREIAASLKRIESRLERLEEIARTVTVAGKSDRADTSERSR
ncbi:MAG: hypothetical protein ACC645_04665 [Pirellulales bacterium]